MGTSKGQTSEGGFSWSLFQSGTVALIPEARAGLESPEGSGEVAVGHYAGLKAQRS